jgi:SAM-dependent methyltransferase
VKATQDSRALPIPIEVLDRCPNCGSEDTRHWCEASDLLLGTTEQRFEYRRCSGCGVVFLRERPLESAAGRAYPQQYQPYGGQPGRRTQDCRPTLVSRLGRVLLRIVAASESRFRARMDRLYETLPPKTVFLDFGCGAGRYLDRMKARGCTTIGMDFSDYALAIVARNGHRALPASAEGWKNVPAGTIDFVRMNHVVEHLYRPKEVLRSLHARMKPGAWLHIAVPSPSGLSALLFRSKWHGLDAPRHVILYPPQALVALLRNAGFKVEEVLQEPLTKDHIRSWVFWLRSKGMLPRVHPDDYMERIGLRIAATFPMTLARLIKRSDRFHVIARR